MLSYLFLPSSRTVGLSITPLAPSPPEKILHPIQHARPACESSEGLTFHINRSFIVPAEAPAELVCSVAASLGLALRGQALRDCLAATCSPLLCGWQQRPPASSDRHSLPPCGPVLPVPLPAFLLQSSFSQSSFARPLIWAHTLQGAARHTMGMTPGPTVSVEMRGHQAVGLPVSQLPLTQLLGFGSNVPDRSNGPL